MPLASGEVFAGYTIVRLVGSGGMGEVYLAKHPRLPREDALKVLPASYSSDDEFRQRFSREADLAATLWNPHIVGVHDRGEFEGRLWISMDYVDGPDAAQLLAEKYPNGMPPDDVIEIVAAVAEALDYAHQKQLLHRDVKPGNILIANPDHGKRRILLADFGIARHADDVSDLTAANITVGSMSYASPEQLMGKQLDGRADQYSLAATAFRLFTGVRPFSHSNPAVVISHHLNSPPPQLASINPELRVFDPVMLKALAKNPEDRFNTCHEFAMALADAPAMAPAEPAPPPPPPPPAPPPPAPAAPVPPPPEVAPAADTEPLRVPTGVPPVHHGAPTGFGPSWAPPSRPPVDHGIRAQPPKPPGDNRRIFIIAGAAAAVLALVVTLVLVNSGGSEPSEPIATPTTTPTTTTASPPPRLPGGRAYTIADYIRDNRLVEAPVHRGDPGAPVLTLPTPPGWADAGRATPPRAYAAIVNAATPPPDSPSVVAIMSKLIGDFDPSKILEYAPNALKNLPGFRINGNVSTSTVAGFDAVQVGGTYLKDGKPRAIIQKTVVIDSPTGLYGLQLNGDALDRDYQMLADVFKAIDQDATITT
ncbi:LpqN/LpqT family lipoprotein [Mycobacterium hubeiense]|uniref:LpqN/LpqT family lipoprotein n=1 Tax=Mycobacterium hubeiense TaxID=1867256 RepID=UPI000C7F461D|nr:LpqN/LpqT family lipoprotein [Mycobacterium sp. QGD 101]